MSLCQPRRATASRDDSYMTNNISIYRNVNSRTYHEGFCWFGRNSWPEAFCFRPEVWLNIKMLSNQCSNYHCKDENLHNQKDGSSSEIFTMRSHAMSQSFAQILISIIKWHTTDFHLTRTFAAWFNVLNVSCSLKFVMTALDHTHEWYWHCL